MILVPTFCLRVTIFYMELLLFFVLKANKKQEVYSNYDKY